MNIKATYSSYSGKLIDISKLKSYDVHINDIAFATAKLCRFGGHCQIFYSVCQHSLMVCDILKQKKESPYIQLAGLFHDSAEAYIGDIIRPIKYDIPWIKERENDILEQIGKHFNLDIDYSNEVKKADNLALAIEAYYILNDNHFTHKKMLDCYGVDPEDFNLLKAEMHEKYLNEKHWKTVGKEFIDKYLEFVNGSSSREDDED